MSEHPSLPPDFVQREQNRHPQDWPLLEAALSQPSPVSVFENPAKVAAFAHVETQAVPWSSLGRYLPEKPVFGLDPLWHAGSYYVQEASSMFAEYVFRYLRALAPTRPGWRVLDLCGAPGGKSINLLSGLQPSDWLLSNEVIAARNVILSENITRWGKAPCFISQNEIAHFQPLAGFFDLVWVDAPCSGEGMFRKDPHSRREWSLAQVQFCAARQRKILAETVDLVREGGYLAYSTCTFASEENEENAAWLGQEFGLVSVQIPRPSLAIVELESLPGLWSYGFYPHRLMGEGLFVSVWQKPESNPGPFALSKKAYADYLRQEKQGAAFWSSYLTAQEENWRFLALNQGWHALTENMWVDFPLLKKNLYLRQAGLYLGEIKGKNIIPSPGLALSTALSTAPSRYEVNLDTARQYLRRQLLALPEAPSGWVLLTYQGQALGWVKNLGNRLNNYYPPEWRLRQEE